MLRATQTFHALGRTVVEGEEVDPKDPIVKGRESLFTAPESAKVEQATAAPGEKRTVRKRTAKKS
jgi:hypothetical protein